MVAAMDPAQRREVSPEWLARITAATVPDPWLHGYDMINRASGAVVGTAAFKAPPDVEGAVEIAYSVAPEHGGKGYATEAAAALTTFAFTREQVRIVRRIRARNQTPPHASSRSVDSTMSARW